MKITPAKFLVFLVVVLVAILATGFEWAAGRTDRTMLLTVEVVANSSAVLFGLAAFLLEQVLVARDERYFKQRKLIPALKKAVEQNREVLDHIAQQFPEKISTYDLNLTLFAATGAWKYDVLDVDLCTKIDELHFELAHLDRTLNCLLNVQFEGGIQQATSEPVIELKGTIQAGVPKTREQCTAVIQLLDQALPRG